MGQRKATIFDLANCLEDLCGLGCQQCAFSNGELRCLDFIRVEPETANEIVLKWCNENPLSVE